jgi:hypothetical protein
MIPSDVWRRSSAATASLGAHTHTHAHPHRPCAEHCANAQVAGAATDELGRHRTHDITPALNLSGLSCGHTRVSPPHTPTHPHTHTHTPPPPPTHTHAHTQHTARRRRAKHSFIRWCGPRTIGAVPHTQRACWRAAAGARCAAHAARASVARRAGRRRGHIPTQDGGRAPAHGTPANVWRCGRGGRRMGCARTHGWLWHAVLLRQSVPRRWVGSRTPKQPARWADRHRCPQGLARSTYAPPRHTGPLSAANAA